MTKNKTRLQIVGGRDIAAEIPDLADIYSMAYKILTELPDKYQPFLRNIIVRVENYPDPQTLTNLHLKDRYDLLGLYKGIPLPHKKISVQNGIPDIIYLFRCPLIRYARENEESVRELVDHVMIHEIGHHFGFTDEELESFSLPESENGGRNRD
ncbi:metallopeptidase family protein [Candidatus Paracaedibacter symbiosus]|uniref:metallopeptidase family protein n=1 Tax=Candidatus Paracaedibacter symbiosus TaxID=244582 RepID=UPI00094E8D94|nr:metallopeptidase family protein [Candidatus Paracaedibacter symbiosus]